MDMQACAHLLAHRRVLGEVRKCDRSVLLHRARLRQSSLHEARDAPHATRRM
jgi:hypothetical protein